MQGHSLFITRKLTPGSPILALEKKGWTVWHESLLDFVATEEPTPAISADWVFFSSPKAVQFFPWKKWTSDAKVACLGPGTAQWVKEYSGQTADWVGNGIPEKVASGFSQIAHGATVLFPRAKNSRRSIQQLIPGQIEPVDWIIYHNRLKPLIDVPQTDLLVFTSPLNAENYYRNYPDRKGIPSISIGATTAQWLRNHGIKTVIETAKPNETSLCSSILHWQKNNRHE